MVLRTGSNNMRVLTFIVVLFALAIMLSITTSIGRNSYFEGTHDDPASISKENFKLYQEEVLRSIDELKTFYKEEQQRAVVEGLESVKYDVSKAITEKLQEVFEDQERFGSLALTISEPETPNPKRLEETLRDAVLKIFSNQTIFQQPHSLTPQTNPKKQTCDEILSSYKIDSHLPTIALASYPRSGNSWTRHIIEKTTGFLTGGIYFDQRLWKSGLRGEGLMKDVIVVKTHRPEALMYPFDYARRREKPPPEDIHPAKKAVYLMRFPFDSFESLFNLDRTLSHTETLESREEDDWIRHIKWTTNEWQNLLKYWLNPTPYAPTLFLRYEDLVNNPEPVLREMVTWLGLEVDEDRLRCAIEDSRKCTKEAACRKKNVMIGSSLIQFSDKQIREVCNQIGDLIYYMGYDLINVPECQQAKKRLKMEPFFENIITTNVTLGRPRQFCKPNSALLKSLEAAESLREGEITTLREPVQHKPVILMWDSGSWHGWGKPSGFNEWASMYIQKKPSRCEFTRDKKEIVNASLVLFEAPSHHHSFKAKWCLESYAFPKVKVPHQRWALSHFEQPEQFPLLSMPSYLNLFDFQFTWKSTSDLQATLICLWGYNSTMDDLLKPPPKKTEGKIVAYFASRCQPDRDRYVEDLMRHIKVDSYGKCLHNKDLPKETPGSWPRKWDVKLDAVSEYKFVLAFENANLTDWVTEKFIQAIMAGAVPVYMGAENIEDWTPGEKSIINIKDFDTPQHLAKYLKLLDEDDELYNEYFAWKKRPLKPSFLKVLNNCAFYAEERICDFVLKDQKTWHGGLPKSVHVNT